MKKFLSILLALAVGFTFTFGSAMSAFAAFSGYTQDEAKDVLQTAYAQATAEDYVKDYDGVTVGTTDITTFTIKAADVQKAITQLYDDNYTTIINASGSIDKICEQTMTGVKKTDVAYIVAYLETQATANATYLAVAEKASFDDYKAFLVSLVDKVDLSVYTTTKQASAYTYNGKEYWTAKEAADANIAYAKAVINNAKFDTTVSSVTESATDSWKVPSYKVLYDTVFGDAKTIKTVPVIDKISGATTGLTYKLVNTYATTASEAGDAATLAAAQAAAKAKLAQAVANYKATDDYVAAEQDIEINAYVEAQSYIIDNETKAYVEAMMFTVNKALAEGTTYQGYAVKAKDYKDDMTSAKTKYTALGYNWNETAAADAEKTALLALYKSGTVTTVNKAYLESGKIISSDLTAGAKAEAKIDYSEVVAKENSTAISGVTAELYQLPVTVTYDVSKKTTTITDTASKYYFEAQWTKVKAAIDTYNAAVDAANTSKDLTEAKNTLAAAISISGTAQIKDASTVYTAVSAVSQSNLNTYASLVYNQALAADSTIGTHIYVTFTTVDEAINASVAPDAKSVNLWYIAKGAETKKEAEAMYKDACAVIDGYKTLTTLKSDAAAVTAKIAALPAAKNVTLADKAAIIDAYDAYDALGETAQRYVTNKVTLDAAVKAVEPLDAYDVKAKAVALTNPALVTIADKEAVKAAKAAYDAYKNTKAYTSKTLTSAPYSFDTALNNIKNAEAKAIKTAYDALDAKYVSNKLTAEDKEAVDALQKAIADYIDEYSEAPSTINEMDVARLAAAVDALAPKFSDAEAKAYVQDLAVTVRTAKSGKKVKVTVNADVQTLVDNGYTVTYKFYKSTKKSSGYKNTVNKTTNTYTNTNPVKGKNYYKVKLVVKNADGAVVATTPLTQCKYGVRTIK